MNDLPTNCMECEHGWLQLWWTVTGLSRVLECRKLGETVWSGTVYPESVTPSERCPLMRKEQEG